MKINASHVSKKQKALKCDFGSSLLLTGGRPLFQHCYRLRFSLSPSISLSLLLALTFSVALVSPTRLTVSHEANEIPNGTKVIKVIIVPISGERFAVCGFQNSFC